MRQHFGDSIHSFPPYRPFLHFGVENAQKDEDGGDIQEDNSCVSVHGGKSCLVGDGEGREACADRDGLVEIDAYWGGL